VINFIANIQNLYQHFNFKQNNGNINVIFLKLSMKLTLLDALKVSYTCKTYNFRIRTHVNIIWLSCHMDMNMQICMVI